jgi:hypothetical protein
MVVLLPVIEGAIMVDTHNIDVLSSRRAAFSAMDG